MGQEYLERTRPASDDVGLPEDEARWFFQQIAIGVDYCHRLGIAHQDIKLEVRSCCICMPLEANPWARVPEGYVQEYVANLIKQAESVLLLRCSGELGSSFSNLSQSSSCVPIQA